jgi:hypothetical protein
MEAYEKNRDRFKGTLRAVFEAIIELGPTHNSRILEYLNQKESQKPRHYRRLWQINQVTGRVNDLVNIHCVVVDMGRYLGKWYGKNKTYHLWRAVGDDRQPVGWIKLPYEKTRKQAVVYDRLQRRRQAERPVLQKMSVSQAGRTLVEFKKIKNQRRMVPTKQQLLFK